ncbi:MAG TPA: DegT/DnrJ/EryC1/StrS family aminotransferase [Dinghuibacter sp.]|uniref:DegT/DnrJ/EryC1/StrS family aminotransferase n=1 Tax=Dinghuibacter sp. TaxID=2024697 RepID=UPI002BC87062|nr:DegT/DnrJ/EryC1/StrS family aminotransferase [Dinghuibacter sp.]HTJ12472.1 DegT/DnrJ/EryC1/StrS family aminotransferase [Dinghuibacter sp.]
MEAEKLITVTVPLFPPLEDFTAILEDIWKRKWLTNNGHYHEELERALCEYLGVEYISLFCNGTLALVTALQALRITGEVITTPYSFVATTHSLWWNNIKPVFVDIDPKTCNLDPDRIEAAITPGTTAIMPVHVYGTPCDVDRIQNIADTYGLKVIYDAAHAFAVKKDGVSVAEYGDMTILSFHATKTYSTIEGGAIVCRDAKMKQRIDYLKNFGFKDEVTVVAPGINAKMNEVQAAYGILGLRQLESAAAHRRWATNIYREELRNIEGIRFMEDIPGVTHNYSYFPVFIDEQKLGMSRDALYMKMKEKNVLGRRYFYPLISDFPSYRGLPSSEKKNLPVSNRISSEVICLPMHHELTENDVDRVLRVLKGKFRAAHA